MARWSIRSISTYGNRLSEYSFGDRGVGATGEDAIRSCFRNPDHITTAIVQIASPLPGAQAYAAEAIIWRDMKPRKTVFFARKIE